MDFRDPKIQKISLGIVAFFVVVYFWYTRLYSKYDIQLAGMTGEYETMITNLKNVEMKSKSLDALKLEYADLLGRYQEIEQLLPEVKQIPSFLVQLHTASSLTGTKIVKIEPQPIKPESFYNVASFSIEMTGTYHDFGKFIGYVANFPFIANVSGLDLKAVAGSNTATPATNDEGIAVELQKPTVTASFTLSTYFVKPEERLQELVI
ncbi:MAG: type 4a pilus biogenesis protein PilO [candidate division Zixibacteria bacterium]|nr:type 4a pilus biogenesis protein PilO [candidate division Zixibacteria bacterium]